MKTRRSIDGEERRIAAALQRQERRREALRKRTTDRQLREEVRLRARQAREAERLAKRCTQAPRQRRPSAAPSRPRAERVAKGAGALAAVVEAVDQRPMTEGQLTWALRSSFQPEAVQAAIARGLEAGTIRRIGWSAGHEVYAGAAQTEVERAASARAREPEAPRETIVFVAGGKAHSVDVEDAGFGSDGQRLRGNFSGVPIGAVFSFEGNRTRRIHLDACTRTVRTTWQISGGDYVRPPAISRLAQEIERAHPST